MTGKFGNLLRTTPNSSTPTTRVAVAAERDLLNVLADRYNVSPHGIAEALKGDTLAARIARDALGLRKGDLRVGVQKKGRPPANPELARQLFDYAILRRRENPELLDAEILRGFYRSVISAEPDSPAHATFKGISEPAGIARLRQTLRDMEARMSSLAAFFVDRPPLPDNKKRRRKIAG